MMYVLDFICPTCKAKPGKQCTNGNGYYTPIPHTARLVRLQRAMSKAQRRPH